LDCIDPSKGDVEGNVRWVSQRHQSNALEFSSDYFFRLWALAVGHSKQPCQLRRRRKFDPRSRLRADLSRNPKMELIIDFGLNPRPFGVPAQPIPVTPRIVTNFFTAKRMLHALQLTIQRHEATVGVLETDVQRRVQMRPAHA
jgi:hypothetical protein